MRWKYLLGMGESLTGQVQVGGMVGESENVRAKPVRQQMEEVAFSVTCNL